ncbi:hypothetical protein [Streptomyces sp. AC512_CC834]|uniref:hypothetical protein n=1 Tax=Streptomyces sp. AC512_CC834 TaxID=2823691 RepID=UPI001C254ED6|nr:hypothetical protein [Streptomyces sp. AC512_CC834]
MTGRSAHRSPGAHRGAGASGVRDALLNNPYGLTLREVRAEIRRLSARGWQTWEISVRFATTRKDATE